MPPSDRESATGRSTVDRRQVLKAVGTTGVLAGSGLAGCLARGEPGPNTIQIAANTALAEAIGTVETELHKAGLSKDVHLDALAGVAQTGARKKQYSRWLSAGLEDPALFMMDSGWTIPFILRDQLVNVSARRPELASTVKDEYYEMFVRSVQGQTGDVYGVPLFPTTGTMLYRKDLVEKAGYAPEQNDWATTPLSWQQFSEVAKQTMEQTDTKWGFSFQANTYEGLSCCDFKEFTGSWGGSYFGKRENLFGPVDERPVTVDSDPVVNATRMVRTFIDGEDPNGLDEVAGDISPRAVLQWTEEPSRKPFTNGDVVMHRNWPYAVPINGAEEVFGEDLGVMPIPYGVEESAAEFDGYGGTTSALGGWHVCLNPHASKQDQEMALEVMEAMTDPNFQLFLFEELGWLPPRPELFESKRAKQVPVTGRYLETLKMTLENSVPRPVTVAWPQESTKIAQKAAAAFGGDVSPSAAMSALKPQLAQIEAASDREQSSGQALGRAGGQ
jgi:ABC-type glycerol-3-phosphate transport system substrate-binding protein